MQKELNDTVIEKVMNRAIEISAACGDECRDFRIMVSPEKKDTLILRWIAINLDNVDKPVQCYQYECFNLDGISKNCSVNHSTQEQANKFSRSLKTLYKQTYCNDHKI